jgi:drug/metabolite transporter (DMT)-like permease
VGASGSEGEHAFTGDLIALLSGVFFAMLTLVLRRLGQHQAAAGAKETSPAFLCLIFGNLLGALIGLPALISSIGEAGVPGQPVAMGWLLMLWLGLGQLGAGYWFFQRGLRTTRALTAGLLNLIEPILNPVWVALVAGEFPTSRTLVGGAILMVALTITVSRPRAVKISPHVAIGSDGASRANAEKR